jgi:Transposase IS66 family
MSCMKTLPEIPEDQKTPVVQLLLRIIQEQSEEINRLKDEIAKLKGQKPRPKIPPSNVSSDAKNKLGNTNRMGNNTPHARKQKRQEQKTIEPNFIPLGSRFKGYEDYFVQDLCIESVEIKLRLAVYITPDGKRIRGELPSEYSLGHFGAELRAFCIAQYFQCHVTAPLLLQQLYEMGIDISAAELSNILIQGQESFHKEKEEVREAGLKYSKYINADDTSSRHNGKNGYCTAISSPLFSYFKSTDSKSRINFLKVLQGDWELYAINEEGLNYAFENGICDIALDKLEESEGKKFKSLATWQKFLKKQAIQSENDIRIATEAALVGGLIGIDLIKLPIISDAAPQFSLLINMLCWVHEERHYRKLIPISDNEREEIDKVRGEIWNFYAALKNFKLQPTIDAQMHLSESFDQIFSVEYQSDALKTLMANTKSRKEGLLIVLKHPIVPLHNNDCERDIREYAKRRKISGSSRSDIGRKARDTFTSLKKTCQKHCISFWNYVLDRLTDKREVPRLADLIKQKSQAAYQTS